MIAPVFGDPRLPERFWAKVVLHESDCWMWQACTLPEGYGLIR